MCQLREHLARISFPAHCTCMNVFFGMMVLCKNFFSYTYVLAGYFLFKITFFSVKAYKTRPKAVKCLIVSYFAVLAKKNICNFRVFEINLNFN